MWGEGSIQFWQDGLSAVSDLYIFSLSATLQGKKKIRVRVEAAGRCGQAETQVVSGYFLEDKEKGEKGVSRGVLEGFHLELPSAVMGKCTGEVVWEWGWGLILDI